MVAAPAGVFDPGEIAAALASRLAEAPEVLLVLGSGLSGLSDAVEHPVAVPFADLPGFPDVGVTGHAGRWVGGRLEGRRVLVQAGRFHLYEGHPPEVVCGPVRVAHRLGVETALLTNAAGGVSPRLVPGTLMLIVDHLNLTGSDPLAGAVRGVESRPIGSSPLSDGGFPSPYHAELGAAADAAARALGIPLARGVYAAVRGPSYETPAEVRALARFGADAVGMSTVPEVLAARALGLRCMGVSVITNRAAGLSGEPLSHDEVTAVARDAGGKLGRLLRRIIRDLPG